MTIDDDFVFTNLQCSAVCLARLEKATLEMVKETLLKNLEDSIDTIPLTSNLRSSLLATGIYLLYSDGKVNVSV
ncbi:hypothetical protein AB6A40_006430 [Gnathostoma spinigerum]|uniref:Uncharacterized protein n=1 Tax=Gnathostoma spinigerum TaxID=75299 RepID=A0ABD6EQL6_9BILA